MSGTGARRLAGRSWWGSAVIYQIYQRSLQDGDGDGVGEAQARVAAMLPLMLRGTPTIFQRDELGIGNVPLSPKRVQDPRELRERGLGPGARPGAHADAVGRERQCRLHRRRAVATAEPGVAGAQRGGAGGRPRLDAVALPPAAGAQARACRAGVGDIGDIDGDGGALCIIRQSGKERILVALNLGGEATYAHPVIEGRAVPLLSTLGEPALDAARGGDAVPLRPDDGLILQVIR